MKRYVLTSVFLGIFAAMMLLTCAGPGKPPADLSGKPDLVPVPQILSFNPPVFDFCNRDDQGKLVVAVKNQGTADASASETKVSFFGFGAVSQTTPPLAVGDSVNLFFTIPVGCFNPDCNFTITVDSNNQVDASSEQGNNTVEGGCIG